MHLFRQNALETLSMLRLGRPYRVSIRCHSVVPMYESWITSRIGWSVEAKEIYYGTVFQVMGEV